MPTYTFQILIPDTVTVTDETVEAAAERALRIVAAAFPGREVKFGLATVQDVEGKERPYANPTDALLDAPPPPPPAPPEDAQTLEADPQADKAKPDLDYGDAVFLRADPKRTVGMSKGPVVTGVLSGDVRYEVLWADPSSTDGTSRTWHPRGELVYCGWPHPAFLAAQRQAADAAPASSVPAPVSASRRPMLVPETAGEPPQEDRHA